MPFHHSGDIRFYTFEPLDSAGVIHAVFTRQGGVSSGQWTSLNLGGTVGDEPALVAENRRLAFATIDRSQATQFDVWQVHGSQVVCAKAPRLPGVPHQQADVILTNRPEITLFMRFADCVPILLFDPVRRVVGLVHSGWKGAIEKVSASAVHTMHKEYGSNPADILAAIGPSIGVHHYPVGSEVALRVRAVFEEQADSLLLNHDGRVQFDLWEANRLTLVQTGVRNIDVAGICTACHLDDWYSHRAEGGRTGRFGVLIALGS